MVTNERSYPDVAALARWMRTWITGQGAIHGFHNHSVWGTNPFTFLDFTSGHAAFSAPALIAYAEALSRRPDDRGLELWRRMMVYQSQAVQPDGQYKHIGFQVGESATTGLIHNVVGSLGLLGALQHAGHLLPEKMAEEALATVRRNLVACERYGGGRPSAEGTCNQEYARVWVKLLYSQLSGDATFVDEVVDDIDDLIALHHHRGVPDEDCTATFRTAQDKDKGGILEPAEYYGLMIVPLVLAYRRYGHERFLDEAKRICRHVVRSAWIDAGGMTRFHRYWFVNDHRSIKADKPMLIAGMGLTLYGMTQVLAEGHDAELAGFVERCLRTYTHYQTPAGYFASATGWHNEADVAPSTAWHAHDMLFLVDHLETPETFWDEVFGDYSALSVLLSDRAFWVEDDVHWAILSPLTAGDLSIYGRKDRDTFTRSFFSWTDREPLPVELEFPDTPMFFVGNDGIYRVDDARRPVDVSTVGPLDYLGHI